MEAQTVIKGIGVDLCSIERMKGALRQEGFAERVFSAEEIAYAERRTHPARHYASAFAAREALAKAGGWGMWSMGLKSCRVERAENGAPYFAFSDEFAAKLRSEGIGNAHLSLSHEGDHAIAMVVLETTDDTE